jgi:hypothetical protein
MLMVQNLKTEPIQICWKNKNDEINFENIMTSELYKVTWTVLQLYSKADMYAEKAFRLMGIWC